MTTTRNLSLAAIGVAILILAPLSLAGAADDRIDKIKDSGVIRICQVDYPPMNIKDPVSGKWTGVLPEMSEAFAAELGAKAEHVDATWGTVVQNIKTDKCDISAAATFVTTKRAVVVLFTSIVTADTVAAWVGTDSGFNSYADLDQPGNVIVANSGTPSEANARLTFKQATIKPIVTDRQNTVLLEVAAGRADAAFLGVIGSLNFLSKNKNVKIRQVDATKLFPTPIAWIAPKGEYHLQQVLNSFLGSARAKGTLDAIEAKWMTPGN
jgi:polar amino acid transport system substrate-binding protein